MTIKLSNVRAERVQDITQEDAAAEGMIYENAVDVQRRTVICPLIDQYAEGFDKINGAGTWDRNPLVWRLCFSVTERHGLKEDGRG